MRAAVCQPPPSPIGANARELGAAAQIIARDDRVSIAIASDPDDVMRITGLSMAARAQPVLDLAEAARIIGMLPSRYPPQTVPLPFPMPGPEQGRIMRVLPTVISLLDYTQGFGHADLVAC